MAQYQEGDIVLLRSSEFGIKIGIMTSPNTVREIRGDATETSLIVKKMSAKDLAISYVDLLERYSKQMERSTSYASPTPQAIHQTANSQQQQPVPTQPPSSANSSSNSPPNPHGKATHTHLAVNSKKTTASHQYKVSATDTTQNTTTTSGTTGTSKDTKYVPTDVTSSGSEPKPATVHTDTTHKSDLDIPKTPNYGNHVVSPTDSSYARMHHYHRYAPYAMTQSYMHGNHKANLKRSSNTTSENDESTATSTISSLSPEQYTNNNNNNNNSTDNKKNGKKKKSILSKLTHKSSHNKGNSNNHDSNANHKTSRFSFHRHSKKKKATRAESNSSATQSSHTLPHDHRPPVPPPHTHVHPHYPSDLEAASMAMPPPPPWSMEYEYHMHAMPYPHPHPLFYIPIDPYSRHALPYQIESHYDDPAAAGPVGPSFRELPFAHIRSNPEHIYERRSHGDTLSVPKPYGNGTKTRISRSRSTEAYPFDNNAQNAATARDHRDRHIPPRFHHPFIETTPSHKTGTSALTTPPIPSPNGYHQSSAAAAYYHSNASNNHDTVNVNPCHPDWHKHALSVVSPSIYSSDAAMSEHAYPYTAHNRRSYQLHEHRPNRHRYIDEEDEEDRIMPLSRSNPNPSPPRETPSLLTAPNQTSNESKDAKIDANNANTSTNGKRSLVNNASAKKHHIKSYKRRAINKESVSAPPDSECVVAALPTSATLLTHSSTESGGDHHQFLPSSHPLTLLNKPEPQILKDPINTSGTGRYRAANASNNGSSHTHHDSREHFKNVSNTYTADSRTTDPSEPVREYLNNYPNENSYTNSSYQAPRGGAGGTHNNSSRIINHYNGHNSNNINDSLQLFESNSPRNSPKHYSSQSGPHTHQHRGGSHSPRMYHSPRARNRPFSAKYPNQFDFPAVSHPAKYRKQQQHKSTQSNTKSVTYSEVEGLREYSLQNLTFRPALNSHAKPKHIRKKPKLMSNAYSSPVNNMYTADYYIHPKHMDSHHRGDRGDRGDRYNFNATKRDKTNTSAHPSHHHNHHKTAPNMDSNAYKLDEDTFFEVNFQSPEKSKSITATENTAENTTVIHPNGFEEGGRSPSFSVYNNRHDRHHNHVISMDDLTPLILSPEPARNKQPQRTKKRAKSEVGVLFDPIQPSRLSDMDTLHDLFQVAKQQQSDDTADEQDEIDDQPPIHIQPSASDELLARMSDDMEAIIKEREYAELSSKKKRGQHINTKSGSKSKSNNNKKKKRNQKISQREKNTTNGHHDADALVIVEPPTLHTKGSDDDKQYKIVLRTADSNHAYDAMHVQSSNNSENLNKPRFSQSTSTQNSFTPSMSASKTPSLIKKMEDDRWQKSMTHNLSTNSRSADTSRRTSSSSDDWVPMLHKAININGNTEDSASIKRRFFTGDEVDAFPNTSYHSNGTVQIADDDSNRSKQKPHIPPKLAPEHELKNRVKKKKYPQSHLTSPTVTSATATSTRTTTVTNTASNPTDDFIITAYMNQ